MMGGIISDYDNIIQRLYRVLGRQVLNFNSKGFAVISKKFDFLVFIGRFQPFHIGHEQVIRQALASSNQVVILIGSAHQPRTTRNPWTVKERETMIRGALTESENQRVLISPLMDTPYNDEAWISNVQATVNGIVTAHYETPHIKPEIGLIGHSKDHSSYYLNLFPQWGNINVDSHQDISATPIREALFNQEGAEYLSNGQAETLLPANVYQELKGFIKTTDYEQVKEEQAFVRAYKKSWEAAPYAPTFVTVDSLVVQSGHILLVERKARPGKGLMALPGGFVNANERLVDACLRELREETKLKVPEPVLRGNIKAMKVFDDPNRSARGRTITHAFHFELKPQADLPKVKGSDDAKRAVWVPLGELTPSNMFEDHYFVIQDMIG